MLSQEIRRKFLSYFKERGHTLVPSSSVIPHDDPTILFTNAGMNQFKDVFLGKSKRDYTRAASAQKCIRVGGKHNDLDNVGHTTRHLTFFEMLGNFSFGDYFKKQAIQYAWEVTTQIYGFDPDQVWITVFREDDEAFELWKEIVSEKRIVRMDEKDNFWSMGETGPCGPCSELYFDRGKKCGSFASPKEDLEGERYLEFWNLVFMQFNRDISGQMTPLPQMSIDTGSGLERVCALKLNVESVFGTDILRSLIAEIENISGKKYRTGDEAPAFHVIADHIRSLAFSIADGAQPSNVERGYIVRKLLRRAVRYGRTLGLVDPFLAKILPRLVEMMGADYPELVQGQDRIAQILTLEEESFLRTLKRGGNILHTIIEGAKKRSHKLISGEEAFQLKDTYGFPLEEILLIAKDTGLDVNLQAYHRLEEEAKKRSRSVKTTHVQEVQESLFKDYIAEHAPCAFVGFENTTGEGKISAIVMNGEFVQRLQEGEEGMILLHSTPFYAEKGGQIADTGTLFNDEGTFAVNTTQAPYPGVIVHVGRLEKGILMVGETVSAVVDAKRRQKIANNHTATHLLHWALQEVLGLHVKQAGSLVETLRLRFDFHHHKPLTKEELRQIEMLINQKIREGGQVRSYEISYEEAQKNPAIKQFFGEKYGATVRVVDMDYSKELCGGTHTDNIATLGYFRIEKEGSIAAGVRRIEAVTGVEAELFVYRTEDEMAKMAEMLKSAPAQLAERTASLLDENKHLIAELKSYKRASLKQTAKELLSRAEHMGKHTCIFEMVSVESDLLNSLVEELTSSLHSYVIVLGLKTPERCQLLARISPDLVQKNLSASELIKTIAPHIGGSGGGKAEMAQAGGKNPEGLKSALQKAREWLAAKI